MAERQCTEQECQHNAKAYAGEGNYGPAWVRIEEVDAAVNTVRFSLNNGGSRVDVKCLWSKENVMPLCPSTLDSDFGRLPSVGAEGTLYLSKALIDEHHLNLNPKWPDAYAVSPEYRPLQLYPDSLTFTGIELSTGTKTDGTLDLLDPALVKAGQSIKLGTGSLTLQVSQAGANCFLVPWATLEELKEAQRVIESSNRAESPQAKARAWSQVAAWQALLRAPGSDQRQDFLAARAVLDEILG
jgi:hypothetical protein